MMMPIVMRARRSSPLREERFDRDWEPPGRAVHRSYVVHAAAINHLKCSVLRACIFCVLVIAGAGSTRLRAETLTLPAVADTYISEHFLGPNGTEGTMVTGTQGFMAGMAMNRGLIKFDFSAIPAGARVTSASLQTLVVNSANGAGPNSFELHRVLRPWNEGQSTWTLRLAPDQNWGSPGAAEGTDYSSTISGLVTGSGLGSYTFSSTPEMVADVTAWITNSSSNQGWLVRTVDESISPSGRRFSSREGASGPKLILELEPPLRIDSAGISNGKAGKSYVIDRRARLDSGSWSRLTMVPPRSGDGPVTICDPDPVTAGSMFYRVQEW